MFAYLACGSTESNRNATLTWLKQKDVKLWEALLGRLQCFSIMLKNDMPPIVAKAANPLADEGELTKITACFENAHEVGGRLLDA